MDYDLFTIIREDDFYDRYAPLVTVLPLCDAECEMAVYLGSFDYDNDECDCDNKWEDYGL